MKYKAGSIGCGNMGGALLRAVIKNIGAENCAVSEKLPEKAEEFISAGASFLTGEELCASSEYIFLAVKPQVMGEVVSSIAKALPKDSETVFITMAAGLEISKIEKYLGQRAPVIRIMPNIPCSLGKGVLLYCCNDLVTKEQKNEFLKMLDGVGLIDEIEEEKIDAASVISGCGPAFVYMFADALAKGAEKCGLDREKAILYTVRTLVGGAAVIENSASSVEALISAVCSPKGSTVEGVEALRREGLDEAVEKAVLASYNRTKELKKM